MKEGWVVKKLGDVCLKKNNVRWNDIDKVIEFKYIDLSSVDRGSKGIIGAQTITSISAPSRAKQVVRTNDCLLGTTRPTLRRFCIIPAEFDNQICSTGFCVLRPNTKQIIPNWLFYCLGQDELYFYLEELQAGANYPAVTDSDVMSYNIPIPPLPEQERIVAVLDAAFTKIEAVEANAAHNLANAKELFQSHLQIAMSSKEGWHIKKLGDVCEVIGGKDYKAVYDVHGKYPIYGSGGMIGYANDYICPENCTLIGRKGSINSPIFVKTKIWNIDTAFGISAKNCLPLFIFYFCKSFDFTSLDFGCGRPSLKKTDIKKIRIGVPSIGIQQQIVTRLDDLSEKVKELEAAYNQTIADCEELKQSLLRQAFNGDL